MKALVSGLDNTVTAFLQQNSISIERHLIEGPDDLHSWLQDGFFDAGIIHLEASNLGIYAPRELRERKILTPLIGISHGSDDHVWSVYRALFLENGGDDLLLSPVNPRELIASMRAVLRRSTGSVLDIYEYALGEIILKINLTAHTVNVSGRRISCAGKEFGLLMVLATNPGRVLSKETLISRLYSGGVDDEPDHKIIDVFACRLRKALNDAHGGASEFIETVWGRGYRLRADNILMQLLY